MKQIRIPAEVRRAPGGGGGTVQRLGDGYRFVVDHHTTIGSFQAPGGGGKIARPAGDAVVRLPGGGG